MESLAATTAPCKDEKQPEASHAAEKMGVNPLIIIDESKPEPEPPRNPPAIPDGGLVAWTQCAGSFFLFFNGFGIINTFGIFRDGAFTRKPQAKNVVGVFQNYYEQVGPRTESSSNISWIGSLQACLLIGVGAFTGPLFDQGYLRSLLFSGTFALVFGMMMTSLCRHYWQFVIAQGLLVGLGCGLHFVPAIAVLPTYFSSKRALTLGIGTSGSSLGGVIYPIIFHQLQPRIGFGWTVRLMAFIMLATLSVPMVGMKMRIKPPARRRLVDLAAWKEAPYALFGVAEFLGYMGVYIPFFYIQLYGGEKSIVGESFTVYLLILLNVGSLFGRLIPNYIADKIGPMNVLFPCCLISALLAFVWIDIENRAGLVVFCLLYGWVLHLRNSNGDYEGLPRGKRFFSGTLVSLPPTVAVSLSPSLSVIGVRMGMLFVPIAAGLLVGNPIAGALLRSGWVDLQAFCGAVLGCSGIFVLGARAAKVGLNFYVKA